MPDWNSARPSLAIPTWPSMKEPKLLSMNQMTPASRAPGVSVVGRMRAAMASSSLASGMPRTSNDAALSRAVQAEAERAAMPGSPARSSGLPRMAATLPEPARNRRRENDENVSLPILTPGPQRHMQERENSTTWPE